MLCYQNYDDLLHCIKNILEQTYTAIELIIADDASDFFDKDAIENYIESNKTENLVKHTILVNEENVGTVRNISNAFNYVSGEYYITCGADDKFADSTVITSFIQAFEKRPEAVWVCGVYEHVDRKTGAVLDVFPTEYDRRIFLEEDAKKLWTIWARRGILGSCSICYRRDVIEKVNGFDLNYIYCEDWPIFLKLLRQGYAPKFINKVVCKHALGGVSFDAGTAGKNVRKKYLEEKYFLFKHEVDPYLNEMPVADQKKYKYYLSEIQDRAYFFDCILPEQTSKIDKLRQTIRSSKRISWILEKKFWIFYSKSGNKFMQDKIICHILMLIVIYLLSLSSYQNTAISLIIGKIALSLALISSCIVITIKGLKYIFYRKNLMRSKVTHT